MPYDVRLRLNPAACIDAGRPPRRSSFVGPQHDKTEKLLAQQGIRWEEHDARRDEQVSALVKKLDDVHGAQGLRWERHEAYHDQQFSALVNKIGDVHSMQLYTQSTLKDQSRAQKEFGQHEA